MSERSMKNMGNDVINHRIHKHFMYYYNRVGVVVAMPGKKDDMMMHCYFSSFLVCFCHDMSRTDVYAV